MAKKEKTLSDTQKAVLDARQKLEAANKAHDAKPTATTEKSVADAKAALKTAQAADNRDRFVRVGGGRVKKARAAIRNLNAVAQPRSYTYSLDDVSKLENALNSEVNAVVSKLKNALANPQKAAKADDDFSFS